MSKIKKPDASNNIGTDFRKLGGYANSTHSSLYSVDMPRGSESDNGQDTQLQGRQSLFNLYNLYTGAGDGIWLDEDLQNNKAFTMPTARTLIEHPRGQVIYDWSDFAYCTYYGKIPNNRLITLRRFAQPVMDDITNTYAHPSPDVARMVTWFDGENNKLEDLMSMSFGLNWKTLKSSVEEGRVVGGGQDGVNGWMRTVAKMLDPKFSEESVKGKARLSIAPNHDANKVYGPIDVIDQTTIRDRGLKFDQSLQLKFFYSCKSIDGINAKSAMIDCLSNMLWNYNISFKAIAEANVMGYEKPLWLIEGDPNELRKKHKKDTVMNLLVRPLYNYAKTAIAGGIAKDSQELFSGKSAESIVNKRGDYFKSSANSIGKTLTSPFN